MGGGDRVDGNTLVSALGWTAQKESEPKRQVICISKSGFYFVLFSQLHENTPWTYMVFLIHIVKFYFKDIKSKSNMLVLTVHLQLSSLSPNDLLSANWTDSVQRLNVKLDLSVKTQKSLDCSVFQQLHSHAFMGDWCSH